MVNPLEIVVTRLNELGFFAFLPFLLTAAILYGLLRRSRIFGDPKENITVNATISLVAAFMVWAYPIISGMNVEEYQNLYSTFFFRGTFASLFFLFGVVIVSMFLPKGLGETLGELKNSKIVLSIILGVFIFIGIISSSILSSVFGFSIGTSSIDMDLVYSIIFLIVFIAIIGLVVWLTGKGEKT